MSRNGGSDRGGGDRVAGAGAAVGRGRATGGGTSVILTADGGREAGESWA